jgi:NAD(P)H dehydrogenase (quinone)
MRDPMRRILKRGLATLYHPACRTVYLALHHRDRDHDKRRRRFIDRVRRALAEVGPPTIPTTPAPRGGLR